MIRQHPQARRLRRVDDHGEPDPAGQLGVHFLDRQVLDLLHHIGGGKRRLGSQELADVIALEPGDALHQEVRAGRVEIEVGNFQDPGGDIVPRSPLEPDAALGGPAELEAQREAAPPHPEHRDPLDDSTALMTR
jgi:hypothetical protein